MRKYVHQGADGKNITTARVGNEQSNFEADHGLSRNQRKEKKTASRARCLPIYGMS